jgi:hypothetical protein
MYLFIKILGAVDFAALPDEIKLRKKKSGLISL